MPFLVMIMILAIPLVAILSKSEMGLAIADAIRHNSGASQGAAARELDELRAEVEHLRGALEEVQGQLLENAERLDFAERLLAARPDMPDVREVR